MISRFRLQEMEVWKSLRKSFRMGGKVFLALTIRKTIHVDDENLAESNMPLLRL
jgi:hypothetical protein